MGKWWSIVAIIISIAYIVQHVEGIPSDAALFTSLNLNLPRLSQVKQYYQQGNINGAKTALVAYLKSRTEPHWFFDPLHPNKSAVSPNLPAANAIVKGEMCQVSICYKFINGSEIKWSFNPTYNNPSYAYDPEWQWQLGRMGWWPELGKAWWATDNTSYASTFVDEMTSWVLDCPVPNNINNSQWSSWRTIEAGIRMSTSWSDAYNRFLTSTTFNENAVILMLKSFLDHGNYLYKYHTSGNWLTMEMNGLFYVGALFPEFNAAQEWRKYAATSLYKATAVDFLPDGMWNELTTGYMQVSIQNVEGLFTVAQVTATSSDVPPGFVAVLQKAYDYNVKMMCPIGNLPRVNDAWEVGVQYVSQTGLKHFPTDPLLIWAASNRTKGSPPPFTSIFLNSSNYIIMRSGWQFNATYALFDVAALGARHYHQDKLNLLIDAYGRRLLYDGGGGPYEESKFRDFAVDTPSHNTVLVDDQPQRRVTTATDPLGYGDPKTPPPTWSTNAEYDFASGYYIDKYGSSLRAKHRREVLFEKQHTMGFIVVDTLTPVDTSSHTYSAMWNLLTTHYSFNNQSKMIVTTDAKEPNLVVQPLSHATSVSTYIALNTSSEIRGWDVDRDPPFYIPALEVEHKVTGKGIQQMVVLLLPLKANEQQPIKSSTQLSSTQFEVNFVDGGNMEITIGAEGAGGVKVVVRDKSGVVISAVGKLN